MRAINHEGHEAHEGHWVTPISFVVFVIFVVNSLLFAQPQTLTITVRDFLTLPVTGDPAGSNTMGALARINVLRDEPGGRRFFVNDLNGPLYIVDKQTRAAATYLDFNGAAGRPGLFRRFTFGLGFANGLINFQFDPDYSNNGRFYTVHLEDPAVSAPGGPDTTRLPGWRGSSYEETPAILTPTSAARIDREAVLIEWTDTNRANATFEGSARELMRVQHNTRIHPMGDMIFNPGARPGDADWRVMYLSCGDAGSGEQVDSRRLNAQRLDNLVGKILRIVPDLSAHAGTSTLSDNGRYRIPRDNPFVNVEGARKEIWAYGLRNPHRLSWDGNALFAASIGLHFWETVSIIRKGANYGYPLREGNQAMAPDRNLIEPLPSPDRVPFRVSDTVTRGDMAPTYPVIQYPHENPDGGDAIAGGYVYRGRIEALRGKFIFGDISTGRIWYSELKDMIAADDGNPETMAPRYPVRIGEHASMKGIVEEAYRSRGGRGAAMPGSARVSGPGRVDIRFAMDAAGELYILSKQDGMIREIVDAR
jgi:hypothetical protein